MAGCGSEAVDLTGSALLKLVAGAEVAKERARGWSEDKGNVDVDAAKQGLLERMGEDVDWVESHAARDIDQVEPTALLSSGARAQERMPTTAVAVGHMMASKCARERMASPYKPDLA